MKYLVLIFIFQFCQNYRHLNRYRNRHQKTAYKYHLKNRKHKRVTKQSSSSSSSSSFSSTVVTSSSTVVTSSSSTVVSTSKGDWKALLKMPLESITCPKQDGEDGEDDYFSTSVINKMMTVKFLGQKADAEEDEENEKPKKDKNPVHKRSEIYTSRYSIGHAAYIFDILDEMFLGQFIEESDKIFKAFEGISTPKDVEEQLPPAPNDKQSYIDAYQFAKGLEDFEWGIARKPQKYFPEFDVNDKNGLNYKEVIYAAIQLNRDPLKECKNCYLELRKELAEFFDFIDCDKDGQISAEDILNAFHNLKLTFQPTTTSINDFVLKSMDRKSATISKKNFQTFVLIGFWERVVKDHEIDEKDNNYMKSVRAGKGGCGKSRRRRRRL